ncbi:unnamed protein product [Camellia sinensis]
MQRSEADAEITAWKLRNSRVVLKGSLEFPGGFPGELVYIALRHGHVSICSAPGLQPQHEIYRSAYLSSDASLQAVVIASHPQEPNQFALGFTDGRVIVIEPLDEEEVGSR